MKLYLLGAVLGGLAVPATAQADEAAPAQAVKEAPAKEKADDLDVAKLMAMFDRIFPAQPDPAPERLALSRVTAAAVLPNGTYGRMMDDMMSGLVDRVLGLGPADFGGAGKKDQPGKTATLREKAIADDPHFEERMRIMQRVAREEFGKIATIIEPRMREGVARSIARRFDARQLADVNAFLATDSGRAFGSQLMAMWVDPDVMRAMVASVPEMLVAMPGAMKRIEAATAHLPKPPKTDKPKDRAGEDKAGEEEADESAAEEEAESDQG